MSSKLSILCDGCCKELIVDSQYPHNYGLHLSYKDYGINTSGVEFCVLVSPPIDGDKDFCGFKCLSKWLETRNK